MTKGIIIAAVGGAVVGAALGLLFAPKAGSDTRADIKDFVKSKCPFIKNKRLEEIADQIEAEIREVQA